MEFRVLGPLDVVQAGESVALGGAKQRAVLALLILHAPDPVSTERLVDALWGERPPASAMHAVQVYISGIRKVLRGVATPSGESAAEGVSADTQGFLEQGSSTVVSCGSFGYRLAVEPEQVDARRFERLVEDGRAALRTAAYEEAERLLGEALSLRRGPVFADFLFMDFAKTEADRLEELCVEALEARLKARVGLGDFAGAVGQLEALVAEHPLREHARCVLMRALYGAGRQADALAVYRDGRRILSEELGLEPGRELRELEQAILRQADPPEPRAQVRHDAPAPAPAPVAPLPLPAVLRGAPVSGYVGRVAEQEQLRRCWRAVRSGQRHAVLVSGEPGIGKTQFAARAAGEIHADGGLVLFGHCPEELAAPYVPWIQALSPFVEHTADKLLADYVDLYGGELARLVPALARRVPSAPAPTQTDPDSERYLLFSAVVGLLDRASEATPVMLLLDDLHWADGTTLALLKYVVAETGGLRLLIVATYRDSDLTRDHPLTGMLADLRREERIERLPLAGLGEHEVKSLMHAAAGQQTNGTGTVLARKIAAETGGNPFFVGEMLRHLSESGALLPPRERGEATRSLDQLGVPQSVREVVLRRVERLGERCRGVLSRASVIGPQFDFELLARIVREDEDELLDLLATAVEACLLQERSEPSGSFSFAHDLINHTLYDVLGATRRSRIHRRVAEALEDVCGEERGPRIEELARHWIAAAPGNAEKAQAYSKQAGDQALAKLAPDEAVRWFARALELLEATPTPDQIERCEVSIRLGEAQRQAGRPEFRATLLHAAGMAEEMHDAARMARAALANSRGFASAFGVVDRERVAVLERAVELNRRRNPARRARLLSLQAMELQFDPQYGRRRALADEALALARESEDDRSLAYVLRDHFHATWAFDTLQARTRTAKEMRDLATGSDDPLVRIWAFDRSLHVAAESGSLGQAAEMLAQLQTLTDQLGQPGLRWHATYYAAGLAHVRGELEKAERLAAAAARLGEQGAEPDTVFIHGGQLCMVRVGQGRAVEIVDVLEQAAAAHPSVPAYEAAHAAVLCDVGRPLDAAPQLERRADRRFSDIPRDQVYSTALALWARVAADTGSERAAALLYDLIEPWRGQFVWNGAMGYGSAECYLGMLAATLGSHDRASEHFAAASRLHEREVVNVWQTLNLYYWARSLLAAGDPADALATAERARALAQENGYRSSAKRAEELTRLAQIARSAKQRSTMVEPDLGSGHRMEAI